MSLRIGIVHSGIIPAQTYGGTERVIWALGKALHEMGNQVTYFVREGSSCSFAEVVPTAFPLKDLASMGNDLDILHFHFDPKLDTEISIPHLVTIHGNTRDMRSYDIQSVFLTRDHAARHGSETFVHNGLDWDDYGPVQLEKVGKRAHFLAKAAWKVKNLRGAVQVIDQAEAWKMDVIGGTRLNFNMGFRFTWSPRVRFHGMVGGEKKQALLRSSRALIFPVCWSEPFGLAVIESLYHGCAVLATPHGSLPELVPEHLGKLSTSASDLAEALEDIEAYRPTDCHEHALEYFGHRRMAKAYVRLYERRLNGESMNSSKPGLLEIPEKYLSWQG